MENNILAKFEYNGKTYVYYMNPTDSSIIKYGILENDNVVETTDQIDVQIMNEASKNIFISSDTKNHIKLRTTMYHGKKFQEMLDEQSELKFFYEIKDNKYYLPTNEDALALFKMFNLNDLYMDRISDDIFYTKEELKERKEEENKIKKGFLLFGVSTMAVIAISTCLLRTNIVEQIFDQNYETAQVEAKFKEEDLIKILEQNPYLGDGEKQIFRDQFEFVMKYGGYTNFYDLADQLKKVRVTYFEGPCEFDIGRSGDFNYSHYEIREFYSTGFDVNDRGTIGHEAGHACGHYASVSSHPGIYEATTEIVNSEHEYRSNGGYNDISAFQKIMYEMIGQDPFGRYQQSGKIKYIINPLLKIIDDKNLANQLISSLDNVLVYSDIANDPNNKYTEEEKNEAKKNYEENNKFIIETLSRYFFVLKGYPMEEDVVSMLYLNSNNLVQGKFSFTVGSYSYEAGCGNYSIKKGYFLNDYKNKYSDYTFIANMDFGEGTKEVKVIINDSNRRVMPSAGVYNIGISDFVPEEQKVETTGGALGGAPTTSSPTAEIVTKSVSYSYYGHGISEALREISLCESPIGDSGVVPLDRVEQVTYLKVLYEIIGKEPLEKFVENNYDINEIVNALKTIIPDEAKAKQLITLIDVISDYNSYSDASQQVEWDDKLNRLGGIRDQINNLFYSYFEQKYEYLISDDALINFYFLELGNKIPNYRNSNHYFRIKDINGTEIIIEPSDGTKVEVSKAYFVSSYINDNPETIVKITSSKLETPMLVNINDDNRDMKFEKDITDRFQFYFDEGMGREKQ